MGKINKDNYTGLSDYGMSNQKQREKTFVKVFITGEPRPGQDVGKMQCAHELDFNKPENSKYIINNASKINFIPMFLKRIVEKYEDERKSKLTYFCWEPEKTETHPEGAKHCYIVAGAALDENGKSIPHPEDSTKTALIYFRLDGIKMGNAIKFLEDISSATENLEPLSDDPDFEKSVISWRRFLIEVSVTTAKSDFGNKYVFLFTPKQQIPDDKVEHFLNKSNEITDKFKLQFDYSDSTPSSQMAQAGLKPAVDETKTSSSNTEQPMSEKDKEEAQTVDFSSVDLGL